MNEDQFEARLKHIEEQAGAMQARVNAYRDQEIARLFVQSGWTQERIAQRMGKSQQHISRLLLFGRFLVFTPSWCNPMKPPKNLTEGRFRGYFERTDKTAKEPRRFAEVLRMMEDAFELHSPRTPSSVGKRIASEFATGKWLEPEAIAEAIEAPVKQVVGVLEGMRQFGSHNCHAERRAAGKGVQYRVVRGGGKKIDLETLRVEVSPIIKQLEIEARKNIARFSPLTIIDLVHKLKTSLDKLAK